MTQETNDILGAYDKAYSEILKKMERNEMSPLDVGVEINKFTAHSIRINLAVGDLNKTYKRKKAALSSGVDPDTGKSITGAKSEVLAESSDEYFARDIAERHLENCNNCILSLKSLLKSMSRAEYAG